VNLLFDQNLSHRLVRSLADIFPNSGHVRNVGLGRADDDAVWHYAAAQSFMIVSKDSDFHQLSFVRGHPPKVVWIRRGNCSTDEIESLLRQHEADLRAFARDPDASFLVLS
jgi:predicted nuclease of predicted toxin-antitoxin system